MTKADPHRWWRSPPGPVQVMVMAPLVGIDLVQ